MTNFGSHLERLSLLFMDVGRSAPRIERIALLYSRSGELQSFVYEYFIVVVGLCQEILKFTKKSALMKFGAVLSDSNLDKYKSDLDSWGNAIQDETRFLIAKRGEEEAKANSHSRSMSARFFKSASNQHRAQARQRVLDFCCRYDYMVAWKQARKTGNTHLFRDCPHYKSWKSHAGPGTLVYTGKLGSGKSVMLANIVDDLHLFALGTKITVAFFFVRHDVHETLEARTLIGSIVQQLLSPFLDLTVAAEVLATTSQMDPFEQMLLILKAVLKGDFKAFVVIDGLDELKRHDRERILRELHILQQPFELSLCFSFRQEPKIPLDVGLLRSFNNATIVSIPENTLEIKSFIIEELDRRLESRRLIVRDPLLPLEIRDALINGSQGMFLWTALQIESLCTMETDDEMRHALNDLPKDLSETFSRILQRANKPGSPYQKWILELITVAQRQLTTEELKEALSVTPGDSNWSPSRLPNDIYSTLACCGGLVIIDEEEFTLRLVHHSAKKYLVGELDNPASAVINLGKAQNRMSDIIITYLYHLELGKQVGKSVIPEIDAGPALSGIIRSTRYSMNDVSSLALKLLRIEAPLEHNIGKTLAQTWLPAQHSGEKAFFRSYATQFWYSHLTWSLPLSSPVQQFFLKLCERNAFPSIESSANAQLLFGAALATGAIDVLKYLMKSCNVDSNCRIDSERRTALHFAVAQGSTEIIETLLESDSIDVKAKNLDGETPMELAAKKGQLSLVMPFLNADKVECRAGVLSPLMYQAAKEGDQSMVATLVNHSQKTVTHGTTVWMAIEGATLGAYPSIVRLLLNHADTPRFQSAVWADNPLHTAVQQGDLEITKCLLQSGKVGPTEGNIEGWSPLFLAAMHGHEEVFMALLDAEALNASRKLALQQLIHGVTPLHLAAKAGCRAIVELAITTPDLNPNQTDYQGNTYLHLAVQSGSYDIVELLVSNDAVDIGTTNSFGLSPLDSAIEAKQPAFVSVLLGFYPSLGEVKAQKFESPKGSSRPGSAENDDPHHSKEWTAFIQAKDILRRTLLHMTVLGGHERATELLLLDGADPSQVDFSQCTPMHYAAKMGSEFTVRILVQDHKSSWKMTEKDKMTIFYLAMTAGADAVVQILLSQMPSLAHLPNQRGETPLHVATMTGYVSIVKTLVENSAIVDSRNSNAQTPLHYAALYRKDQVATLLLSHGASPTSQDAYQSTPLHYAARTDAPAVAECIFQYDTSLVNMQDDRDRTPLHIAAMEGRSEMVRLLLFIKSTMANVRDEFGRTPLQYALGNGDLTTIELFSPAIDTDPSQVP